MTRMQQPRSHTTLQRLVDHRCCVLDTHMVWILYQLYLPTRSTPVSFRTFCSSYDRRLPSQYGQLVSEQLHCTTEQLVVQASTGRDQRQYSRVMYNHVCVV